MDVVRQLTVGDHDALAELFATVLPDFADLRAPEGCGPDEFLREPSSFVFGAYVDEAPAGLAWGVRMRYPNGRLVTYLHELDVLAEYRRRGLATALVTRSMKLARERGSTRFWLSTGQHNTVAQSLYESLDGVRKPLGDVNYWWELT
jgi:ribosomal protein S18 acetylase RimI-like enzyme